jgi:uncharacterized protein YdaU (DUF1376 family)
VNYFDFHIGDYAKKTSGLSLLEDAVHMRLLRRYYDTEGPLPASREQLYRIVGARTEEERRVVDTILADYFISIAEGWENKRAEEEIAWFYTTSDEASAKAKKGWETCRRKQQEAARQSSASDQQSSSSHDDVVSNCTQHPVPNTKDAPAELSPDVVLYREGGQLLATALHPSVESVGGLITRWRQTGMDDSELLDLIQLGVTKDGPEAYIATAVRKRVAEVKLANDRQSLLATGWN